MSDPLRLLLIDDDPLVGDAVRILLPHHWVVTFHDRPEDIPFGFFHAAIVDMHLTGSVESSEGCSVLEKLRNRDPHLALVAMSGNINRQIMEKCLHLGASRFLAKPLNANELLHCLDKIEASLRLKERVHHQPNSALRWLGGSKPSKLVLESIAYLKGENGPILISGATGTGKEVVARLLHEQEGSGRPFVTVNMASLPEHLFESEFFGHVKNAFTGADHQKTGLAEAAEGGDLFLDELEALPLSQQAKMLRFLETGEVRKVGSNQVTRVNTRVLLATNESLEKLVKEKRFRDDLMWRVKGKCIQLPTLSERTGDIRPLAEHFLLTTGNRKKTLSSDALDALILYEWPGNVRELKRVCEQLLIVCPLPIIRGEDVNNILPKTKASLSTGLGLPIELGELSQMLNQFEKAVLEKALTEYSDLDDLCRKLGLSRSTVYRKLKDHQVQWRNL